MTGPVSRSLGWFRKHGLWAYSVSRFIPQARRTVDFAGFADIIAYSPKTQQIIACQTTTTSHQANRLGKVLQSSNAEAWMDSGGHIQVHGWALKGLRGQRKTWQITVKIVHRVEFTLFDQTNGAEVMRETEW